MTEYSIKFINLSSEDLKIVGGKVTNLIKLMKNNFPVPDGFVIVTEGYRRFAEYNNLSKIIQDLIEKVNYDSPSSINEISEEITKLFINATMPEDLRDSISTFYNQMGDKIRVAVRSSATAEDLPEASFAGQQDTYLNIFGETSLIKSIQLCYASLWTARAIAYRKKNSISHTEVKLAVIIQQMINSKCSGVMFTANPISLTRNEILLESSYGLGESIVSGLVNPDQFIVTKKNNYIKSREISIKEKEVVYDRNSTEKGVETINVEEEKKDLQSISDKIVIELAKLGNKIEKIYKGKPQDIEWAVNKDDEIFILQSRPITSLIDLQEDKDVVWTRGYSDDYWNDPVTPLYYNLLGDPLILFVNRELNSLMGYPDVHDDLIKLHHGHVYFNLNVLRTKVENEIPTFLRNETVLNYFPEGSGPYGKETMKKLPFQLMKRLIAEIRVMLHDYNNGSISETANTYYLWNETKWIPFCKRFYELLNQLKKENAHINRFIDLADELEMAMIPHWKCVRYGIPVHSLGMSLIIQYLLKRFLGEKEAQIIYPMLISDLTHKTTQTNEDIIQLTRIAIKSEKVVNIIRNNPSDQILSLLKEKVNENEVGKFLQVYDQFIEENGDRGFTREVFYPRWRDEPKLVFDLIKSLSYSTTLGAKKGEILKKKATKYVEYTVGKQFLGIIKVKVITTILGIARKYLIFRENQRFNLDLWITRNRHVYLEIGKRFVESGYITNPAEIFFFHKNEIRKLVRRPLVSEGEITKIKVLIKKRAEIFYKFEHTIPPKFIQGSREYNDPPPNENVDNLFKGIPASQGTITGKIRVITDIGKISEIKVGDILVVPKTDPGWTPIFSIIGGLITETGGILSHGAVVSREYGIPAVTNIVNASKMFSNGQMVTVDGNIGTVIIEKEV